jgi:hypothetical protein
VKEGRTQIQAAMKLSFLLSLFLLLVTTAINLGAALPLPQPKASLSYFPSPTPDVSLAHLKFPINLTYSTLDSLLSTRDTHLLKRALSQAQIGAIGACCALGGPFLLFLSFRLYRMSSRPFWVRGNKRAVGESAGLVDSEV